MAEGPVPFQTPGCLADVWVCSQQQHFVKPAGAIYASRGPAPSFARHVSRARARASVARHGRLLASSVAGKGRDTSPTGRGVFVLEQLLCTEPPEPPGDVDTNLKPLPPGVVLTNRERMDQHRSDPACAACHALFDPIGYAFEVFDWVGAYRRRGTVIDPASRRVEDRRRPPAGTAPAQGGGRAQVTVKPWNRYATVSRERGGRRRDAPLGRGLTGQWPRGRC